MKQFCANKMNCILFLNRIPGILQRQHKACGRFVDSKSSRTAYHCIADFILNNCGYSIFTGLII